MKFHIIPLSVLSLTTLASFIPSFTPAASAACVMVDPSVQVAVHGSPLPSQQINNVNLQSDGRCLGAVTTNVGEQVYVGSGPVEQVRTSNQFTGGDPTVQPGGPVIGVPVYVPVDVYAPAYDPGFYANFPYAGYSGNPGYDAGYSGNSGYGAEYPSGY